MVGGFDGGYVALRIFVMLVGVGSTPFVDIFVVVCVPRVIPDGD